MTHAERSRARYAADPEFWRAKSRAYYARNRERILAEKRDAYWSVPAWRQQCVADQRKRAIKHLVTEYLS